MAPMSRKRATLSNIADQAGVSVATVSYVLNDKPGARIPEQTQNRIRHIAEELGYTPNLAAQALRTGKSRVVLLIIPDLPINFTMGELMLQFGAQLDEHGYIAVTLTTGSRAMDLEASINATSPVAALSLVTLTPAEEDLLAKRKVLHIGESLSPQHAKSPGSHLAALRLVNRQIDHLLELGHTRIGWAHPVDNRLTSLAAFRREAMRLHLQSHNLPEPVICEFPLSGDAADEAIREWRENGVTAVACYSDLWAMAVVVAARRANVKVPEELAVIGIDNIPLVNIVEPPVTSISFDMQKYVAAIVQEMLDGLKGCLLYTSPSPRD